MFNNSIENSIIRITPATKGDFLWLEVDLLFKFNQFFKNLFIYLNNLLGNFFDFASTKHSEYHREQKNDRNPRKYNFSRQLI